MYNILENRQNDEDVVVGGQRKNSRSEEKNRSEEKYGGKTARKNSNIFKTIL